MAACFVCKRPVVNTPVRLPNGDLVHAACHDRLLPRVDPGPPRSQVRAPEPVRIDGPSVLTQHHSGLRKTREAQRPPKLGRSLRP
jgi:hypothetical protein